MTIAEMQEQAHATALEKGWYDGRERGLPELIALMHSELSEALEEYRRRGLAASVSDGGKPEGVAVELADALIRIADACDYLGLDLQKAVEEKMAYNRTRPYRHGNKLA